MRRMKESFAEDVEKAINQVVNIFQANPKRFWNKRDLLWILFHYLNQQEIFQDKQATDFIRAEFPTRAMYQAKKTARGHYDLAILQPESLAIPNVSGMAPWAPWGEYLSLVKVSVAVELKMWLDRWSDMERVQWDIQKLTDAQNAVQHAYLLSFAQLDFSRPQMQEYYRKLRGFLIAQKKRSPNLKILCVPSDAAIQPETSANWL